jgi:benzoate-CoA ligase
MHSVALDLEEAHDVADGTIEEVIPALLQPGVAVEHRIASDKSHSDWLAFDELLAAASPECAVTSTTPNSPCFWLYSSGSTGAPKASVHEHKDMVYTSEFYAVGALGLREDDIIFSAPKLFFAPPPHPSHAARPLAEAREFDFPPSVRRC